ncbi:MAG: Rho termination factor N-terminal domain-containing protein, partial [Rhodanobacter sp.]
MSDTENHSPDHTSEGDSQSAAEIKPIRARAPRRTAAQKVAAKAPGASRPASSAGRSETEAAAPAIVTPSQPNNDSTHSMSDNSSPPRRERDSTRQADADGNTRASADADLAANSTQGVGDGEGGNPRPYANTSNLDSEESGADSNADQAGVRADGQNPNSGRQGSNNPREGRGRRRRNERGSGPQRPHGGNPRHNNPNGLPVDDDNADPGSNDRVINLTELKRKNAIELLEFAEALGVHEGVSRARRQDVIFNVLKAHAR